MKNILVCTICYFFILSLLSSCKKNEENKPNCFANEPTIRTIVNSRATIKIINDVFYIIEDGSIDSKLAPCNLPADFRVDNLSVIISGEVKPNNSFGYGPCCYENFVIAKISK